MGCGTCDSHKRPPMLMAGILLVIGLLLGAAAGFAAKPGGVSPEFLAQKDSQIANLQSSLTAATEGSKLWKSLSAIYTMQPPASMPDHSIKDNGDGTVFFLHFDTPEKKRLLFIGHGVWGNGCKSTQDRVNAVNKGGYTHFHTLKSDGKMMDIHGIGSLKGTQAEGFWFKHVAAADIGTDNPMAGMFLGPSGKPLKAGDVAADFSPMPVDSNC